MPFGYGMQPEQPQIPQDGGGGEAMPSMPDFSGGMGGGFQDFQIPPLDIPSVQSQPDPSMNADVMSGLSPAAQTLHGEYMAMHQNELLPKLEELDKAAKFRRALSMLTETFATISGRPDIAALERFKMEKVDKDRAAQIDQQIMARVGAVALAKERQKADTDTIKIGAKVMQQQQAIHAKSTTQAVSMMKGFKPNAAGELPDVGQVANALALHYQGDDSALQQIHREFPFDPNAMAVQTAADKTVATNTGAAGAAKVNVGSQIAGAGAAAAEFARTQVEKDTGQRTPEGRPKGAEPAPKPPEEKARESGKDLENSIESLERLAKDDAEAAAASAQAKLDEIRKAVAKGMPRPPESLGQRLAALINRASREQKTMQEVLGGIK